MKPSVPLPILPLCAPLAATLRLPGSKSHANRAIIAACLCEGQTTLIENATSCDDVALMVENLQKMGFAIEWIDQVSGTLRIQGGLPATSYHLQPIPLSCGNAGTTLRFLTSLCCVVPGEWIILGDEHMRRRPIGDLTKTLRALGADIRDSNGCPPLHIRGKKLEGGDVTLDASKSSQFLSSLLLIAPMLSRGLSVTIASSLASPRYVDITKKVLADFGIHVAKESNTFIIQHQRFVSPKHYDIERDWSAAGAWIVLASLTNSSIEFVGMNAASTQSDKDIVNVIKSLEKPGDLTIDCAEIPDQVMNIALCAACRSGTTTITGAANLRLKECDRLAVITSELRKVGIDIREHADGVIVQSTKTRNEKRITNNVVLDPHSDHRMAMCFAILGCVRAGIRINNPECVAKSYPHFFNDLAAVRTQTKPIAIVGMRAVGKSNLARRLASKLGLKHLDTDKEFERQHGKIPEYVQKNGWEAFRHEEESVVHSSLKIGVVTSLGGGATESDRTRSALKEHAVVVWMQATERMIVERLKITKRPKLTTLPVEQEVRMMLRKRDPQYKEIATIILPPNIPFGRQTPYVLQQLQHYTCSL